MEKDVAFQKANPVQYLATIGRDGKAKRRPFMFCCEHSGKLWCCTNSTKEAYRDMQENPEVDNFSGLARICLGTAFRQGGVLCPLWAQTM